MSAVVIPFPRSATPVILIHRENGLGETRVELAGVPVMAGCSDRYFVTREQAIEHALDLQYTHNLPAVEL